MTVAIYNTRDKELIGVFRNMGIAGRYIFSEKSIYNNSRIWNAYLKNVKLHVNTNFDFPIAVRLAKDIHLQLLSNNPVYISDKYPQMTKQKIKGMAKCSQKNKNI